MISFADNIASSVSSMSQASGMDVRHQSVISPTEVGIRTHRFLTGLYPHKTALMVAADTGLSVASLEKMLERRSAPGPKTWPALAVAYRGKFLAAVVPDLAGWLDPAVRAERHAQLVAEQARITRELQALSR